jgi:hypothetical protein
MKRLTSSHSHTSPPQHYSASAPPVDPPTVSPPDSSSLTPEAHDTGHYVPKIEFEGESSMSAHADYAARFLQDTVKNRPYIDLPSQMTCSIRNLHEIMTSRKPDAENPEVVFPNARRLPDGTSARSLQLPPVDVVFACLRMVDGSYLPRFLLCTSQRNVEG